MEHRPRTATRQMGKKLWIIAKNRRHHTSQKATNATVELAFKRLLARVKELSTHDTRPIFERDYRHDNKENAALMHAFMSSGIYLVLECDYLYNYQIEYAFNNCQFESEIRAMLAEFPFDKCAHSIKLRPDYSTFYKNVLNYQDKKYILQRK